MASDISAAFRAIGLDSGEPVGWLYFTKAPFINRCIRFVLGADDAFAGMRLSGTGGIGRILARVISLR